METMIAKRMKFRIAAAGFLMLLVLLPVAIPFTAEAQGPPVPVANQRLSDIESGAKTADCGVWNFPCHLRRFMNWAMRWVMAIFLSVTGLLIALMSSLIELMISMSRDLIGGNPLVQNGFRITLGIANLGFVLAIIVIAFATILRIERYELKKTLERLIIAAVLVNFSLVIAGIIFDFTNVLAYFFISKASPDLSRDGVITFGQQMATSLNFQDLVNIKGLFGGGGALADVADLVIDFYMNFVSLFLALAFSILVLIVFSALAFMLVVRYIYLTVLIILMPLAWLFWTIPSVSSYWSKWWSKFFQWTFFLPAVTFFLYLAMLSSRGIDSVVANQTQQQFSLSAANPYGGAAAAVDAMVLQKAGATGFLQLFVKMGLFVAALMAGQSLGITGAKGAMGIATGMGKKFTGYKPGWLKDKAEKAASGIAKGSARVPLLRQAIAPFSKPVQRETTKVKAKQAEKILGSSEVGKESGANKLLADYRSGGASFHDIRRNANRNIYTTLRPGERRKIAEARLAMANVEEEGVEYSPATGMPVGELEKLSPSESRKNQKMATKIKERIKKGEKVKKKEEEEEKEEKHNKDMAHLAHELQKHLGHGGSNTEKKHGESDEDHKSDH